MSTTRTSPPQTQPQSHEIGELISHLPVHTSPPSTLTSMPPSSANRPSQSHRASPSNAHSEQRARLPENPGSSRSVSASIPRRLTISPEPHQFNTGSEAGSFKSTRTQRPLNRVPPTRATAAETIQGIARFQARRRREEMNDVAPRFRPFQGQTASSSRRAVPSITENNKFSRSPSVVKGKQREEEISVVNPPTSIAPSNDTMMSNTSVSTARYMEFERGLRRRVILQILRNTDLQNSSTTLISDQGVIMNISEGTVVACEQPKIKVAFSPIRDEEFEPYRKQYPAPFSEDDKVRGVGPRSPVIPDREPGDEPPPRQGGGSERSRQPSNNERPPPNNFRVDGGDEGPPEPSDDGGPGNNDRDNRSSRHPSEGSILRMGVPEQFNPRSLAGIGEFYTYEPKTVSEEDCLNEILRVYIDLVNYHLIMKPATGNNNAQKTILQNIPKPEFYYGEEDIMKFDTWVRTLIRWLNVAD
ncbi:hypothetical protein F5878DRAFT_677946, partial [Lentinula raphanica]